MIADAVEYAKRCKVCQNHTDFIHKTPELLHPTVASWPFKAWRIDVLGTISPPLTKGHWFILAITNYFLKRAKVVPLIEVKMIMWSTSSNTMSSTDLVSPDGSSTTMVPNLQANCFISFATSIGFIIWLQLPTTLSPTG